METKLKNIIDLPVIESAVDVNLIVNADGAAKQVPSSAFGVVTDEHINSLIDARLGEIENGTY